MNATKIARASIEKAIERIGYDFSSYSLNSLISHIERVRKRRIKIIQLDLDLLTGAWLSSKDGTVEYIFINEKMNFHLKEIATLHEIGHYILGHKTLEIEHSHDWFSVMGSFLKRDTDSRENNLEEYQAEMFAQIILQKGLENTSWVDIGF